MLRSSSRRPVLAALLPVLLALSGCAPAAAPPSAPLVRGADDLAASSLVDGSIDEPALQQGLDAFVDLRDGRSTVIRFRSEFQILPIEGEPEPPFSDEWSERLTIVGERVVDGVPYRLEEIGNTDGSDPTPFESLFRQDRSGLYLWQEDAGPIARHVIAAEGPRPVIDGAKLEQAIAAAKLDPTAAAAYRRAAARITARADVIGRRGPPGGVGVSEITFLRYPMRPGASWVGRVEWNVWTVEARENIDTPAGRIGAWRLNIDLPRFFGPADRYQTWWGAPGEVKRRWHSESEARDERGQLIGVVLFDQEAELVSYTPGS